MNLDKSIAAIEAGFKNPDTKMYRTQIPSDQLINYGLRRKGDAQALPVWVVSVGETGAAPTATFIHFKLNTAMKKALEWRGVMPNKRGPRKNGATAQQQPQAG